MTSNPGKKFDGAKLPVGRGFIGYFGRAIKAVAAVSKYGAQKYAVSYEDKNWERLDDARLRYGDGRARHIVDEAVDGPWDPESKLLHAAHAAWNAMAYLELCLREGMSLVQPETDGGKNPAYEAPGQVVYTPGPIEPEVLCQKPGAVREMTATEMEMLGLGYVAPIHTILGHEHFCAKAQTLKPGHAVECEPCKTAIYGAREL